MSIFLTNRAHKRDPIFHAAQVSSRQDSNYRPTLFFTIFVQHIALAAAAGKSYLQIFVSFASLLTKIEPHCTVNAK